MSIQSFPRPARLLLFAALTVCSFSFASTASAAWLATPYQAPTSGQLNGSSVTINPDQSFGVIWGNNNGDINYGAITAAGVASPAVPVGTGNALGIHSRPDGGNTVFWRGNGPDDTNFVSVGPTGTVNAAAGIGTGNMNGSPISAVDSNGVTTVVWQLSGSDTFGYARISASGVASAADILTVPASNGSPALATDDHGNTYFGWTELGFGDTRVRLRTIDPDGVVSAPRTAAEIGSGYTYSGTLRMTASANGDLLFGVRPIMETPSFPMPIYAIYPWAVYLPAGAVSGVATSLGNASVNNQYIAPTLAGDGSGQLFVSNYVAAASALEVLKYPVSASGVLGPPTTVVAAANASREPQAVSDNGGTATLVYHDASDTVFGVRIPMLDAAGTPADLFPGHTAWESFLTSDRYGNVAVSAQADNRMNLLINYMANPPACTPSGASTAYGAPVALTFSCKSRDAIMYSLNSLPAHGSATVAANGSALYTPAVGFSGTDTFSFVANNAAGASPAIAVTVKVGAAPITSANPVTPVTPSAKFPKGKIKAGKKVKLSLTAVVPGSSVKIVWKLKKKSTKGSAISTKAGIVTFKAPKKKGKYSVTVSSGSTTLFRGKVKVS